MRVLGIDPGMRITGYGCVELTSPSPLVQPRLLEAGVLRFKSKQSVEDRLVEMHASIAELIAELEPDHVAVEKLYAHYKHPRTAIVMGHARGVILLAARQAGKLIAHLPATEVKKSITGNGHATKQQMQLAVAGQCGLAEPPNPPDVADAIAIALTAARRLVHQPLTDASAAASPSGPR
ncbi:crossover junction endodeoxyribonuclease RuvC [Planctomycetales bacterium ZRK34]|nr:crossover junction endodeoxyribonuclease RuvC [Planctomycetales bacterium ZRK34]